MKKIKEYMRDRAFIRGSLFIVFNAFLLYVLYFVVKNFSSIASSLGSGISALLSAFSPLFIGLIISYLLNPLVTLIDKKLMQKVFFRVPEDPLKAEKRRKLSRFISVLLTFIIVLAAISVKENGIGGIVAQGIGTSMLQVSNIIKNPWILVPPTLASAILGPLSTVVFKMTNVPAGAGMGTSGLVGQIGTFTAMGFSVSVLLEILLLHIALPALLSIVIDRILKRAGKIKVGDYKLDL